MAFFEAWSHEHLVKFAYEAVKRMEDQQHQIENMYDAWDCGDRHEIRQQVARREEITRMARESGLWYKIGFPKEIERFANLVAAAEREKCALVVERNNNPETRLAAAAIRARVETK